MTSDEYATLVTSIYDLIIKEINFVTNKKDVAMSYPKIVTMYEFFRLLRGEAFIDNRPPTSDEQKGFYKMEDEIAKKIDEIKNKIDFEDERVKHYIEEAKTFYEKEKYQKLVFSHGLNFKKLILHLTIKLY